MAQNLLSLKSATVKEIKAMRPGYIEAVVDIAGQDFKAICYSALTGEIGPGDRVIVNTTAIDLGLGTGGFHFVLWNLSTKTLETGGKGHIMKLRYTPLQIKCLAAEEEESPYYNAMKDVSSIGGMPVVVGTLHSQLPAAAAVLRDLHPDIKIAYIMTDGAALPLAFSRTVAELKELGIIDTTITVGHAFGGDIEAINIYSALAAARCAVGAEAAIVTMGPGIVGSNTKLGFTGIEQGQVINAVNSLQGVAIAIPRISFSDKRERHFGISHHTITALKIAAMSPAIITIPELDKDRTDIIDEQIARESLDKTHRIAKVSAGITFEILKNKGLTPTTMGRSVSDDPEFFMAAGAAAVYAASIISGG